MFFLKQYCLHSNFCCQKIDKTNEQIIVDFFRILHIDSNVAIEKRNDFDATNFVQNIKFFDVTIDETFNINIKKKCSIEITKQ